MTAILALLLATAAPAVAQGTPATQAGKAPPASAAGCPKEKRTQPGNLRLWRARTMSVRRDPEALRAQLSLVQLDLPEACGKPARLVDVQDLRGHLASATSDDHVLQLEFATCEDEAARGRALRVQVATELEGGDLCLLGTELSLTLPDAASACPADAEANGGDARAPLRVLSLTQLLHPTQKTLLAQDARGGGCADKRTRTDALSYWDVSDGRLRKVFELETLVTGEPSEGVLCTATARLSERGGYPRELQVVRQAACARPGEPPALEDARSETYRFVRGAYVDVTAADPSP